MSPSVAVIIPVKNDAKRLIVCLNSLPWSAISQVVVVDNGSTDESLAVAQSAGCLTACLDSALVGALRNHGVSLTQADVIAFVDSDHEVSHDWIQKGCEGLADSSVVGVGAYCLPPRTSTWVQSAWAIHRLRGESPREVDWLGAGNLFVRRADFLKVDGFREDLVASEDVDLCHRLKETLGGKIICDQQICNIHHGEPKTISAFFRKELWRGSSGLKAWVAQGFPLCDLPSFLWPLWHLCTIVLFLAGLISLAIFGNTISWLALGFGMLAPLPSILLAIKTCFSAKEFNSIPGLAILYFVYGLARAAALLKTRD
jgi:glycosyltransferase involved in cell wall biosynthesis